VFVAQLGHLIEHISKAIQGQGLLGPSFDTELSHLLFNGAIALLSVALVAIYPRNPWVYPLIVLAIFHALEHVYIYQEFLKTGIANGPGLLGRGGAIGLIPLDRVDLHNVYNGFEMILLVLGFGSSMARSTSGSTTIVVPAQTSTRPSTTLGPRSGRPPLSSATTPGRPHSRRRQSSTARANLWVLGAMIEPETRMCGRDVRHSPARIIPGTPMTA
jgi:hypothetical protein